MKRLLITLVACLLCFAATAQRGYRLQYWFDGQYGNHHTDTIIDSISHLSIDVSQVNSGFHTLYMHIQDSSGRWSTPRSYLFYRYKNNEDSNTLKYIYWFDQNRNTYRIDSIGNGHLLLDVSSLDVGFHTLNMQIGTGSSTLMRSYLFYRFNNTEDTNTLKYISWFDQNRYPHSIDSVGGGHLFMDVSALDGGFHTLNLQIGTGSSTSLSSYLFYKMPEYESSPIITCWFDQNRNSQWRDSLGNGHLLLDVSNLGGGFHTLNMQIGTGLSARLHNHFFYIHKDSPMKRYEYWLNGMDSLKRVVDLNPPQDTLRLVTLLPVDTLPIRSTCFHFIPNNGNPFICAKNDITLRFWTEDKHSSDQKTYYLDYNVVDTIFADTLERDTTKVIAAPRNNNIHWFKLAAGTGDSLLFRTNSRCTMQLYAPSGAMVYHVSADSVLEWSGLNAMENGVYYLAVHDAEDTGTISVSHQWIYKYAVLAWDVHRVGNGGISTITFKGNGFDNLDTVYLIKGRDTVPALYIGHEGNTTTSVFFNFERADTGMYNAVFAYMDENLYKNNVVRVETARPITLATNCTYPSTFLRGNTVTYTLTVTNTGNMTAYQVPLQIYISSATFAGISHLELQGLQLKKLYEYLNNFDSLSVYDQQNWIEYSRLIGEEHYFLPHINADGNGDSVAIRLGYFFIDIKPYEVITISLSVTASEAIEAWFSMPESWVAIRDSVEPSNNEFIFSDNDINSLTGLKTYYCCHHDTWENWATGISQGASAVGLAALLIPEPISKSVAAGAALTSVGTSLLSYISSNVASKICRGSYGDMTELSGYDHALSLGGMFLSILGALPHFKYFAAIPGFLSALTGVPSRMHNIANRESVRRSPECSPNSPKGGTSTPVIPVDPNEITGYIAESGSHGVSAAREQLYYTIEFENDSNFATTHANTVVVRDTLDGSVFDLNSFAATAFSIGKDVDNINGLQRFTRTMDMRPAINTIAQVQLDYTIDSNFAVATWTFSSLDPMTLQPVVADSLGFLRIGGTGEVDFLIRRKANLPDSTLINNRAYIVFDNEDPIATSIWHNIVDNTPPISIIDSVIYDDVANVHISATDNLSGVWRYNVYGQDSVWHKLAENIPIDSVVALDTFIIQYSVLRAIAIDSAGNMELLPVAPDTTTYQVLLLVDTTQGYVAGGGRFRLLDTAIISATPKYGFHFSHWSDGDTTNPRVVTVLSDSSFTALFDTNYYNIALTADDTLKGSVSGGGSHLYMHNARLTATPNYGFYFSRWNDGDTNNPRVVTVLSDSSFTALFDTNYYNIALSADDSLKGSVSGGGSHLYMHNARLIATANYGFHFLRWSDGDTTNPRVVTVLSDSSFTALFDTNYYNIALTADDTLKGSVSGGGNYLYLHNATLTATANYGFHFLRWNDGDTNNPRVVTVLSDSSFTALFDTNYYNIALSADDTLKGSVSGGGSYLYLHNARLTATPNHGFHFSHWSDGDTNNPRLVTVLDDTAFTALFDSNAYNVVLAADYTNKGHVYGGGRYNYLSTAMLSATANHGFHFSHWSDGDTNNPRVFIVTQDTMFIAYFLSSQSITVVDWDNIKIIVYNREIIIEGVSGERVYVSDVLGRVVYNATVNERAEIAVKNQGIYFVKIGSRPAQKVVVIR